LLHSLTKEYTIELFTHSEDKKGVLVEWIPSHCPQGFGREHEHCNIHSKGFHERVRCFDVSFPFLLKTRQFVCLRHSTRFHAFSADLGMPFNIVILGNSQPMPLIIFERTILVSCCACTDFSQNYRLNSFTSGLCPCTLKLITFLQLRDYSESTGFKQQNSMYIR